MYYLTANNGPHSGRRYELRGDRWEMGRHPDCQIVVDVGAVSRKHCQVVREGSVYFIEDLGSRNGTFLNEEQEKIEGRRPLKLGDVVRVCEVSFTFTTETPFQPPAPRPGALDGANLGAMLEDEESSGSTIMSKLDVSASSRNSVHVSASAEVKLAALVEITQSLGKALVLDDVLPQLLKSLFKIFVQADRGFIVLENPDGKLTPRWVRLRREDDTASIRISRTIIRHVMQTKEAILSADAINDQRFELSQSIADFRIRSMMCAPLIDPEGKSYGALQIDTLDQRQRFTPEDLELLVSTASQASIAISNAQMLERTMKQREVERDMVLARDVQRGFLPDRRPLTPGYDFYDFYQAADQIGGDYFDYIELPDGRLAIVVADVVGHGIAAALLMAKVSAETRYCLYQEPNPAKSLSLLNDRLSALNIQRFVTMIMVVIDPRTHRAVMVNAGHMSPLHRRRNGALEEPAEAIGGLPLGISAGYPYEQTEVAIDAGESLLLYTDGINEAIDSAGAFYTLERLRERVLQAGASTEVIGATVLQDVKQFLGKAPQADDMCMVCFGRLG